jgi:hypothetical protein
MIIACLLFTGVLSAADAPYIGKWKMNPDKSDLKGTTITYSQAPDGMMEVNADGMTYKFKADGKSYPAFFGVNVVWKQLDANTWQVTSTMKNNQQFIDTMKIAADGKTMNVESKGTKPNGEKVDDKSVYQRVSGGPGLMGKWKTTEVKSSSPGTMELAASGTDGLTFRYIDQKITCDAKFDGKDYPCTGPTLPEGITLSAKKAGNTGLEVVIKDKGKPLYRDQYAVSADGKSLNDTGVAVITGEKITVVYDRQ